MDVRGRAVVVKVILPPTVIFVTVNLAKSLEEKICFCFALRFAYFLFQRNSALKILAYKERREADPSLILFAVRPDNDKVTKAPLGALPFRCFGKIFVGLDLSEIKGDKNTHKPTIKLLEKFQQNKSEKKKKG